MRTRCNSETIRNVLLFVVLLLAFSSTVLADELRLVDGSTMKVDEAWEDAQGGWFRRGGVTYLVERARVREIVKASHDAGAQKSSGEKTKVTDSKNASDVTVLKAASDGAQKVDGEVDVWIYLVGGARMEVDEANESAEGVWYRRGNISTFVERARVDHVERVAPETAAATADNKGRPREWR